MKEQVNKEKIINVMGQLKGLIKERKSWMGEESWLEMLKREPKIVEAYRTSISHY